jgi:hypothetical protein
MPTPIVDPILGMNHIKGYKGYVAIHGNNFMYNPIPPTVTVVLRNTNTADPDWNPVQVLPKGPMRPDVFHVRLEQRHKLLDGGAETGQIYVTVTNPDGSPPSPQTSIDLIFDDNLPPIVAGTTTPTVNVQFYY